MKRLLVFLINLFISTTFFAQINAKLFRYMDVSDEQICFVYGGDIWLVDKNGGTAIRSLYTPENWTSCGAGSRHMFC